MVDSKLMLLSIKNLVFAWWRYLLVALIFVAVGGYFYLGNGNGSDGKMTISRGDFMRQINISGSVVAAKNVDLGFAESGRIAGVYAKVGQKVYTGTVLAETENGDLVASLSKAKADLDALLSGTRPEEIAVASVSVANAEVALIDSIRSAYTTSDDAVHNKADLFFINPRTDPKLSFIVSNVSLKYAIESDRVRVESSLLKWAFLAANLTSANVSVYAKQAQSYLAQITNFLANSNLALNQGVPDSTTTASTISSYATTLATARTSVNSAVASLTNAMSALDSALKNLELKNAGSTGDAITAQRAIVANAQSALAKTYVVAPFSGVITKMDAKVGASASPTESLISMQSDGIFQIETFVPEVAIADVAVGNDATITLDSYDSSIEFGAKVVAVDPAETMKDGVPAYKTTLSFLKADSRIRSGMTANVVITTGVLNNAIVIPAGAIVDKSGIKYVSVFSGEKTITREVITGTAPALGQIEILSGLSDEDIILLTPVI